MRDHGLPPVCHTHWALRSRVRISLASCRVDYSRSVVEGNELDGGLDARAESWCADQVVPHDQCPRARLANRPRGTGSGRDARGARAWTLLASARLESIDAASEVPTDHRGDSAPD